MFDFIGNLGNMVGGFLAGVGVFILFLILFFVFKKNYIKAPPDEAVIISGRRKIEPVAGRAVLRLPILERDDRLTLKVVTVAVETSNPVPTSEIIGVKVSATVNVKIPIDDKEMFQSAAENFLNMDETGIANLVRPVLEGSIREIVGKMTLTEMIGDRAGFADLVKASAAQDLRSLGLEIKTFNVRDFYDERGVIVALGIDNETRVKKDAAVSKAHNAKIIREETAKAEREANEAEVAAKTAIAERENEFRIRKASLKQESDSKQAEADAAYQIQQEEQRKTLDVKSTDADIARQERNIELQRQIAEAEKQRLSAEVEKKADAERYASQQAADARQYTEQRQAEAELFSRLKEAEAKKAEQAAEADAEAYSASKDAEAKKALAEADKFAKEQEAAGINAVGIAEANALKAKGFAEAESIEKKAEAMKLYGQASILEMVVKVLPEVAHEIASPMSNIGNVSIIGGNGDGIGGLTDNVPLVMAKVFKSIEATTGIDLADIVRGDGEHAQITRNVTVTGANVPDETELIDAVTTSQVSAMVLDKVPPMEMDSSDE